MLKKLTIMKVFFFSVWKKFWKLILQVKIWKYHLSSSLKLLSFSNILENRFGNWVKGLKVQHDPRSFALSDLLRPSLPRVGRISSSFVDTHAARSMSCNCYGCRCWHLRCRRSSSLIFFSSGSKSGAVLAGHSCYSVMQTTLSLCSFDFQSPGNTSVIQKLFDCDVLSVKVGYLDLVPSHRISHRSVEFLQLRKCFS